MQAQRVERRLRLYYLAGQIFYLYQCLPQTVTRPTVACRSASLLGHGEVLLLCTAAP